MKLVCARQLELMWNKSSGHLLDQYHQLNYRRSIALVFSNTDCDTYDLFFMHTIRESTVRSGEAAEGHTRRFNWRTHGMDG